MNFQAFLQQHGSPLEVAVGEHVFMQGDVERSLYWIEKGFFKAYYITEDGKEQIKSFLQAGDLIGSLSAVYAGGNCTFSLECLEAATLLQIPFNILYQQANADLEMSKSLNNQLLNLAMKKETREYELLCLSAEERYQRLISQSPEFLEKTTQENIAKYLGVTPVGLSRIKKRLTAT